MTDDEYASLKLKVETLKEQKSQAAGAYAELMKQLKEEYGLDSIEAAEAEIVRLEAKEKRLKTKADIEYGRLLKKWKSQLNDLD